MRRWNAGLAAGAFAIVAAGFAPVTAQPSPPTRFYGSVTVDGVGAAAGTAVRAFVGEKDCTTQTFPVGAGQYAIETAHTSQVAGCGTPGGEVSFRIGTRTANEKGTFEVGSFKRVNLTFGGTPPPPPPPPSSQQLSLARLPMNSDTAPCIPVEGQTACDDTRQKLWVGDQAAWTAEMARQGKPEPNGEELFLLTYELRIGAMDPAAIASLAQGLGWPKVYITAVQFQGTAAGEADEFVELMNVGGASQDMTGWRLNAVESNTDFYFSDGTVLEPGARCRFYTNQIQADSCPGTVNVSTSGVWNDGSGRADLWYDPFQLLADRTRYNADPANQPPPPNLRAVSGAPAG